MRLDARCLAQPSLNPPDQTSENALALEVSTAVTAHRNHSWGAKLESLDVGDNSLGRMVKIMQTKWSSTPPIHAARSLAYIEE